MQTLSLPQWFELGAQVMSRVSEDEQFRAALQENPKKVLSQAYQLDIPDKVNVQVVEDTQCVRHLVLPYVAAPVGDLQVQQDFQWYVDLLLRAYQDEAFKQQLLTDPKAAVREASGVDVPSGLELKVLAETAERRYLAMPPSEEEDSELSDEDLRMAVGGSPPGVKGSI
jgi:hypothetical protein